VDRAGFNEVQGVGTRGDPASTESRHGFGCLIGNGLSVAYNPELSVRSLTEGILQEISNLSGGDAEQALFRFARGFGPYKPGDFENVLGLLESVGDSLMHLRRLTGLARSAKSAAALDETVNFVRGLYRQGFGTALALIAERAQGQGEAKLEEVIVRTCEAIARLDKGPSPLIVVGTLNYDGLLLAGFLNSLEAGGQLADLADGRERQRMMPSGRWPCLGTRLRNGDDFPRCKVELVNLHGSLGWLEELSSGEGWKFEFDCLRIDDFWNEFKAGNAVFAPMVVLTNQKERAVLRWPYELAYRIFERRIRMCDRRLIAGYSFGDVPVNAALSAAAKDRQDDSQPPPHLLVLGHTEKPHALQAQAAEATGIPRNHIEVDGSGIPDSVEGRLWRSWAA